jgi:hypothetical protein
MENYRDTKIFQGGIIVMKKYFYLIVMVLILAGVVGCSQQPEASIPNEIEQNSEIQTIEDQTVEDQIEDVFFDTDWDDRSIFKSGLIETEYHILDELTGASYYLIDLKIDKEYGGISGDQKVRYTNQEDSALDVIYFRLFSNASGSNLKVSDVQVDGFGVEGTSEYGNSAFRVPLATALDPGKSTEITLSFTAELPLDMAGNYGLYGYFDGSLVLDEFYPVIPVYDDEGWNVDDLASNGDLTYNDVSFYKVRVTAPDALVLAATGEEIERVENDGMQIVTFAAGPVRDFYVAGNEHWVVTTQDYDGTTINIYAAEKLSGVTMAMNYSGRSLGVFSQYLGDYPYTSFDVAAVPMLALGMEYPGIVTINEYYFDLKNSTQSGIPASVILPTTVIHEVGHQWFYNLIGSDQADEPWVDEAFTQFITGYFYLDQQGEAGLDGLLQNDWKARWGRVDYAKTSIGLPCSQYNHGEYSPIVYGRGPIFVAQLRTEMTPEAFDAFMYDYATRNRWGIGYGEEILALAQEYSEVDLTEFIEEFFVTQ